MQGSAGRAERRPQTRPLVFEAQHRIACMTPTVSPTSIPVRRRLTAQLRRRRPAPCSRTPSPPPSGRCSPPPSPSRARTRDCGGPGGVPRRVARVLMPRRRRIPLCRPAARRDRCPQSAGRALCAFQRPTAATTGAPPPPAWMSPALHGHICRGRTRPGQERRGGPRAAHVPHRTLMKARQLRAARRTSLSRAARPASWDPHRHVLQDAETRLRLGRQ